MEETNKVILKHDHYQTETTVTITILQKNLPKDSTTIEFSPNNVRFKTVLPETESEYVRDFNLLHPINPEESTFVLTPSKIEIKLKKLQGGYWDKLERDTNSASCSKITSYPTSKPGKNWDEFEKLLKEEESKEKPEGEDGLNKLFQDIYGKGNDDIKRAMNKSFMESGGTVLSTNWNKISQERVAVNPPDGMEFKKWDS